MATKRQKLAANNIAKQLKSRNLGKRGVNLGKAMRDAGYSDVTAKTPENLTEAKGFKELLELYIPESLLLEKTNLLINAKQRTLTFYKGDLVHELIEDNSTAIRAGLDMGYKVRGLYAATKVSIVDPLETMRDDEINNEIEEMEAEIKRRANNQ